MKTGRPTAWNPFSSFSSTAWTEVVQLASKERLSVPISIRRIVPWVDRIQPSGGMLAIMELNGVAELMPWTPHGESAVSSVKAAAARAEPAAIGNLILAAMDRYVRLTLDTDGRTVLPFNLLAHVDPSNTSRVRVLAEGGRLWLWSERQWEETRPDRLAYLKAATGL